MNDRSTHDPDGIQFSGPMKWRGRKLRFVRNRLVMQFQHSTDEAHHLLSQAQTFLQQYAVRIQHSFAIGSLVVVDIASPDNISQTDVDQALLDLIDSMSLDQELVFVEPDLLMVPLSPQLPRDADLEDELTKQWGWLRIGMDTMWRHYPGNEHVIVCVLDTGWYDHVDLDASRVEMSASYTGSGEYGADATDTTTGYSCGHGTKVLGIIAATQDNVGVPGITGINMGSRLHVCRVVIDQIAPYAEPEKTIATNMYAAVHRIIQHAQDTNTNAVINISWVAEYEALEPDYSEPSDMPQGIDAFRLMCTEAKESGRVILCCGAGNNGPGGMTLWPALFARSYSDTVLSVGGTTIDINTMRETPTLPDLVPTGPDLAEGIWRDSPTGHDISVVAPGDQVKVLQKTEPGTFGTEGDPRDKTSNDFGTSLSTAFVTGLTSIMWSANPDLSPGAIVNSVKKTAQLPDGYTAASVPDWGHGRIYAPRAIGAVNPWPAAVAVCDLSKPEVQKLNRFADFLREVAELYQAYVDIGVVGTSPALALANIGASLSKLQSALLMSLGGEEGRLNLKLFNAYRMLRGHTGTIEQAQPNKGILVVAGESSTLTIDTIVKMHRAQSFGSMPVHVIYVGESRSESISDLTRVVEATGGEMVNVSDWKNDVEAAYWLSRFLALTMGRTIVANELWSPTDTTDTLSFPIEVEKKDLDVDVIFLHRTGGTITRALTINGVDILASPQSLPGVVVDKKDRYIHARISTGTRATTGTWYGRVVMAPSPTDNATAVAVLATKRTRA